MCSNPKVLKDLIKLFLHRKSRHSNVFFFTFGSTKIRTIPFKSRWLADMHLGENEEISVDNANRNCLVHVQMLDVRILGN